MDWYWVILIAAHTPLYLAVGWACFGGISGLLESVRCLFTPDIVSLFSGEWEDDQWAQLKFAFYIITCAVITWGVHLIVQRVTVDIP